MLGSPLLKKKKKQIDKKYFLPFYYILEQGGSTHFLCQRADSKYFRFCEPYSLLYLLNSVVCALSRHVGLFATLWTIACQAPLSRGFSRQEYWSGLPCPPPGDLLDAGIELVPLMSPALAGRFLTTSALKSVAIMQKQPQTTWVWLLHRNIFFIKQAVNQI